MCAIADPQVVEFQPFPPVSPSLYGEGPLLTKLEHQSGLKRSDALKTIRLLCRNYLIETSSLEFVLMSSVTTRYKS